jgi:hypothetical protein
MIHLAGITLIRNCYSPTSSADGQKTVGQMGKPKTIRTE